MNENEPLSLMEVAGVISQTNKLGEWCRKQLNLCIDGKPHWICEDCGIQNVPVLMVARQDLVDAFEVRRELKKIKYRH